MHDGRVKEMIAITPSLKSVKKTTIYNALRNGVRKKTREVRQNVLSELNIPDQSIPLKRKKTAIDF